MDYIKSYENKGINLDISSLEIEKSWSAKYLYRKLMDDIYLDTNGYYPSDSDDDYQNSGIITNVKPIVENGYITQVRYYKVLDQNTGHGRPCNKEKPLVSKDIKAFTEYLDDISIPNESLDTLEKIIETAINSNKFINGWKTIESKKNDVVFADKNNNLVSIKKKDLLLPLELTHTYLEIFNNPYFWDANKKLVKSDYKMQIMSLLSFVDVKEYANYEKIKEETEKRTKSFNKDYAYQFLTYYAGINDEKEAKKYLIGASKLMSPLISSKLSTPIYSAVKNKHYDLVISLLKKGNVEINAKSPVDDKSALYLLAEQGKYDLIDKALELTTNNSESYPSYLIPKKDLEVLSYAVDKQDGKLAEILLRYGYDSKDIIMKLNDEQFEIAVSSGYACTSEKIVKRIIKLDQKDVLKRMIKNSKDVVSDGRNSSFDHDVLIGLIIKNKIIDVFEYALKIGYDLITREIYQHEDYNYSYHIVYDSMNLGKDYISKMRSLFVNEKAYEVSKKCAMHMAVARREIEKCKYLLDKHDINPDHYDLYFASSFKNQFAIKKVDEEVLKFVIENCELNKPKLYSVEEDNLKRLTYAVLAESSIELCKYFLDSFNYFDYFDNLGKIINDRIEGRNDADEIRNYAVKAGVIKEAFTFDPEKGPTNIREHIYYKNKNIKDYSELVGYVNDKHISYYYHNGKKTGDSAEFTFWNFKDIEEIKKQKPSIKIEGERNSFIINIKYDENEYNVPLTWDPQNFYKYNQFSASSHWIIDCSVIDVCNNIANIKKEMMLKQLPDWFITQAKELDLELRFDEGFIDDGYEEKSGIYVACNNLGIKLPKDNKINNQ